MHAGRRADRDDIERAMIEEAIQIVISRAPVFGGQALRFLAVRAAHRGDFDARNTERPARVRVTDIAGAEDADLHARRRILMLRNHT